MFFDAVSNEYTFSINNPTLSAITQTVTCEVWVWPRNITSGSNKQLYNKSNNQGFRGRINTSGVVEALFYNGLTTDSIVTTLTLSNNTWYQIVVVHTSTSVRIYINGIERASTTTSGLNMASPLNEGIQFGRYGGGGGQEYFDGGLSIMRVYNSALSASDVLQNFNFNRGRFGM
jgi:hypothetical protein